MTGTNNRIGRTGAKTSCCQQKQDNCERDQRDHDSSFENLSHAFPFKMVRVNLLT